MEVEIQVSQAQLEQMIQRVEHCFSNVNYESPFRNVADENFYEAGRAQVRLLEIAASRAGISLNSVRACFELGCGHGRATIPLSERFPKVVASDISAPHLEHAAAYAQKRGRRNITFMHANTVNALKHLPPFNLFYSKFVLQHSPPPIMSHVLHVILSQLEAGGLGYFQISVYQLHYKFDAEHYLATAPKYSVPEMHMLPQRYLFELLAQYGCHILEVREDGSAGQNSISLHLFVQKA
jgi:trans-aconitate methyltransferase